MNSFGWLLLLFILLFSLYTGIVWLAALSLILGALIISAGFFSGAGKVGKETAKGFSAGIGEEVEKASPKGPKGEVFTKIAEDLGSKIGEGFFAPESHTWKTKNLAPRAAKGSGNLLDALKKIFRD